MYHIIPALPRFLLRLNYTMRAQNKAINSEGDIQTTRWTGSSKGSTGNICRYFLINLMVSWQDGLNVEFTILKFLYVTSTVLKSFINVSTVPSQSWPYEGKGDLTQEIFLIKISHRHVRKGFYTVLLLYSWAWNKALPRIALAKKAPPFRSHLHCIRKNRYINIQQWN